MTTLFLNAIAFIGLWSLTKWKLWIKILLTIILTLTFFFALTIYLYNVKKIRPITIVGKAMLPSYTDGMFVTTKLLSEVKNVKRGDVVVFNVPSKNVKYIKRVVGLPGEKFLIKNGAVFVNGEKIDESFYIYPNLKTEGGLIIKENVEFSIPNSEYVLLGDNRPLSNDSRNMGSIQLEDIVSVVGNCYKYCK